MATNFSSPTAWRWELAARLRQLRVDAGLSLEDVAAELLCSPAKLSRLETAGRSAQPRDVRDLCRLYGVPDAVRLELMRFTTEARKPGWWQGFRSLGDQAATFTGLESAAVEVRALEGLRVPGLLQTTDYARSLVAGVRPQGEWSDDVQEDLVAVRARRQERLVAGDLRFSAIIDEAVLRRIVGSPRIMIDQIDRLRAVGELPLVRLQMVPFSRGAYPGLDGAFSWMHFDIESLRDVILVEGLIGNFLLERSSDVRRYAGIYQHVAGTIALDPDETERRFERLRAQISERLD